jgi:hypothetical protein
MGPLVGEVARMRGRPNRQITMLAFIDLEERVPSDHPLRAIKRLADEALADLSSTFDRMYAKDWFAKSMKMRTMQRAVASIS